MSYYFRDANGYLRDAGSIGGWEITRHALRTASGVVRAFLDEGKSRVPVLLADGAESFLASQKAISEDARAHIENLILAAKEAEGILILTDGTDDREDEVTLVADDEVLELEDLRLGSFAQVKKDLDELEDKAKAQFKEVIEDMRDHWENLIRAGRPVKKVPYLDEFRNGLARHLRMVHTQGRSDGWKETRPSLKDIARITGKDIEVVNEFADSFTPKSAIKWLKEKELFVTGVFSDGLLSGIKNILVNALKTGAENSATIEKLYDLFEPYLGSKKLKEGVPPEPHRLNTMIRTVTTEAYNHGRLTEYLDPGFAPYLLGIRYSAILDERTTEVCRLLDGRVFKPGDPDLPGLTPPNHFNCRSILVPVVVGEEVEGKDYVTAAQKRKAKSKADIKFLEQEE